MGVYVDETFLDAYIGPIFESNVGFIWLAYTSPQKTDWITRVENVVDNIDWLGSKTNSAQANEWPRSLVDDAKLYPLYATVDHNIITWLERDEDLSPSPASIKDAIAETIIFAIRTLKFDKLRGLQEINTEAFGAGSVEFDFRDKPKGPPLPVPAWELVSYLSRKWWKESSPVFIGRV